MLPGDFSEAGGHHAGQQLLASRERPDAVFAANDMMALGCLFAFSHGGVSVPGDIALAGFDDIPLARYVHPSLTTIRVNIAEIGERAVLNLLSQMADGDSDASIPADALLMDVKLVVRESSAARPRTDSS